MDVRGRAPPGACLERRHRVGSSRAGGRMTVESALDKALEARELSAEDGEALFAAEGDNLRRLLSAADERRRSRVGERVAYVINRNVNFTNVCVKRCGFCAFSRGHRAEQGYFLPLDEVLRRVREAWDLGATEA